MKKELKYLTIEYTDKDLDYIDEIIEGISNISEEVVEFFGATELPERITARLYGDYEEFVSAFKDVSEGNTPKDWVVGFSFEKVVRALCLEEYRKRRSHQNGTIYSIMYLILHEFVHSVHQTCFPLADDKIKYYWLGEGIACTISHQYNETDLFFDATEEEMTVKGTSDYRNYYTMFKYVLDTYGRDYILELIKNNDLLVSETPKLYEEVKNYIKKR